MVSYSTAEKILVLLKLLTVAAGFFMVYLGWRSYKARRQKTVLWLTVGLAVLTLGAIAEGAAVQGLEWSADASHLFEGLVTLLGFGILVYSLYAR